VCGTPILKDVALNVYGWDATNLRGANAMDNLYLTSNVSSSSGYRLVWDDDKGIYKMVQAGSLAFEAKSVTLQPINKI
ncbi:MAG: hypothetical protein KBS81_03840, partial [Spirochaetales bacterium]|nr:hypothetical protein [Candidatus Physcosoma equi]